MVTSTCPLCSKGFSASTVRNRFQAGHKFWPAQAFIAWQRFDRHSAKPSKRTASDSRCSQSARCTPDSYSVAEPVQQTIRVAEESSTPVWDVVGLGQPMVDFSASVEDDLLVRLGIVKGSRR